ncbi:ribonuclease D [Promineifilum sp.]|uniref:ribonuclease D n=1 Tax=Promineifilum sp. TaxID=2664178 RepID=UPI0035AD9F14
MTSTRNSAPATFRWVDKQWVWAACLGDLQAAPRLGIDLEANSMFAYDERACLIQISTATTDYIIDPLATIDLSPLGAIIENPAVEKIFHAAEYDLILLRRDYGWELNNLFDTMWAARILGYTQFGLAGLLRQFYGLQLSKRFQKSNWCHRPLSPAELAYAQNDTHYLLDLRDRLGAELEARGHTAEAQEIFREQSRVRMPNNGFDPDGFWRLNGAQELPPGHLSALQALYLFRDREAKRRNAPHFKVLGDRTLLELATRLPARPADLDDIHGMSAGQQQRYGRQILDLIAAAREAPPPPPPKRPPRPSDAVLTRYDRLHRWRKAKAQARGVESDVIMSRDALWVIAEANPGTLDELSALDVLGPWRLGTYGEEVVGLFKRK